MTFDWIAYRAGLSGESDEQWENAADLSRLSLNHFSAEQGSVRRDYSQGFLRLTGDGVVGHSAHIDDVADAMRHFQRLVLANGMALSGHRSLRGALPSDIVSKTRLNLNGSPLPGSLVLQFIPATLPSEEIAPSGQAEFFNEDEKQLVDSAVGQSLELLNLSKSAGPDVDASEFIQLLTDCGPRVSTTLRDFAKSLADAQFSTEVVWMQPRKRRVVSRMSGAELENLGKLVASRELAKEPLVLQGTLRTVSDISPLRVEMPDGEIATVHATALSSTDIKSLLVGMIVKLAVTVSEEASPGGNPRVKYVATTVEIVS